jgi:hypothetical protein
MTINIKKTDQTVEFTNADGKLCATYHYMDKFKSFFRGLYTPNGKDVVLDSVSFLICSRTATLCHLSSAAAHLHAFLFRATEQQ